MKRKSASAMLDDRAVHREKAVASPLPFARSVRIVQAARRPGLPREG